MRGRSRRQNRYPEQQNRSSDPRYRREDPAWVGPGWSFGNNPFVDEEDPGWAQAQWEERQWDRMRGTNDMAQGRGILRNYGNMGPEVGGDFSDEPLRGPAGAFAGRGPKNYKRSDSRIHEDICDAMTEHHELDARNIDVVVKDGEVTLEGTVSSRIEKRLAEDLAHDVRGVFDVHNRLRVQQAPTESTQEKREEPKRNGAAPQNGHGR